MDVVGADRRAPSGAVVVLGVNTDDLGDHRPGQKAAAGSGRRVPARRGRVRQGRRTTSVAPFRAAHVGQAGGGVPRQPHPVRHGGDRGAARSHRPGRSGAAPPGSASGSGPSLRRHGATGSRTGRHPHGARPARGGRGRRASPPATDTSRSTSRGSGAATSTTEPTGCRAVRWKVCHDCSVIGFTPGRPSPTCCAMNVTRAGGPTPSCWRSRAVASRWPPRLPERSTSNST